MLFSKEVGESLTYKFAQTAGNMKAQGREIISLGLGEPDFATPDYVVNATIEALNGGFTHYSTPQGLPELRKLIATDVNATNNTDFSENDVIITPGIKSAVYFALASILEPNDEVVMIAPYYVSYPAMVKLAEPTAKINVINLNKEDYSLNMDLLVNSINENTKCILLNSPNNPTGTVLSDSEMNIICEMAVKYNFYIVSDEVYEKLIYKPDRFKSFASCHDILNRLIVCNGFSKSHAMTGWRLGYAIGANDIIKKMNKLQQHINTNTCTFIQKGACSIYSHSPEHLNSYIEELKKRMNYFDNEISKIPQLKNNKPNAGFFDFVDISKTGMDSNTFCSDLLEKTGIATTPGIAFGAEWDDHVRFSLAVPFETIERAIGLIREYFGVDK